MTDKQANLERATFRSLLTYCFLEGAKYGQQVSYKGTESEQQAADQYFMQTIYPKHEQRSD